MAGVLSLGLAPTGYLWAFGALLAYGALLLGAVFMLMKESRADARGFLAVGMAHLLVGHVVFALT